MYKEIILYSQISKIIYRDPCQHKIKIDEFQLLCYNATVNIITNDMGSN